ncbi:MAG: hypothetical protein ACT4P1_17960 [Sporichthyaceae bacterium]
MIEPTLTRSIEIPTPPKLSGVQVLAARLARMDLAETDALLDRLNGAPARARLADGLVEMDDGTRGYRL